MRFWIPMKVYRKRVLSQSTSFISMHTGISVSLRSPSTLSVQAYMQCKGTTHVDWISFLVRNLLKFSAVRKSILSDFGRVAPHEHVF